MPDDKAWGIIPARGGSKGIPAKNLQTIRGWSLIARAVKAAKGAARVARVFVSTDDAAIAAEAVKAGAEIIDRPAALSGDTASSEAALLHALDTLERSGPLPASFAFVQCTSPFLTSADIDGTIAALATGDSAFSAAPSHRFLWRDAGDATGVNHDKARRPRRQERAPEFVETGGVYAMRIAGFRAAKHRFFGKTVIHPLSPLGAFEIDEPADLDIARALAPLCDAAFPRPPVPSPLGAVLFDFDGVLTDDLVVTRVDGR